MKVRPDFENELKDLDSRLTIVDNPNRPELANIKLDNIDICPIPREEIRDNPDPSHFMVSPNGWKMTHKSRMEALGLIKDILEQIKTPEGHEIFFDKELQK